MCKAIDINSVCCLPTYSRKLAFWLLLSEFLGRFFQIFFTWVIGGRIRQWCMLGNFKCRGVLMFWIIVGRTELAVGAVGIVTTIISYYFSFHID